MTSHYVPDNCCETHVPTGPRGGTWGSVGQTVLKHALDAMREFFRLIVPLYCAGCGAYDCVLCPRCAAQFSGTDQTCRLIVVDDADLPTWSGTYYQGPVRNVMTRWKEHGRADVSPLLARSAAQYAVALLSELERTARPVAGEKCTIAIVPMPSSQRSRRVRGFVPAHVIAYGVQNGLLAALPFTGPTPQSCSTQGPGCAQDSGDTQDAGRAQVLVSVVDGLTVRRSKRDQQGLGASKRRANIKGKFRATIQLQSAIRDADILLLVDDVVTTGATLREARRAIAPRTGTFVAGFSLVATPSTQPTAELVDTSDKSSSLKVT